MSRAPDPATPQPQTITHCYIDITLDDLAFAVGQRRPRPRLVSISGINQSLQLLSIKGNAPLGRPRLFSRLYSEERPHSFRALHSERAETQ